MQERDYQGVVYFDGECGLCQRSVVFLLARDRHRRLRYAALQSPRGQRVRAQLGWGADAEPESLVFEDGVTGELFLRSDGFLRAMVTIGRGWQVAGIFRLVPRGWRDAVYRWVARHRIAWFGRAEAGMQCRLATPEEKALFLED